MASGAEISLIITLSVFPFVIFLCVGLFVIRYSHPDDNTGLAPKIVAIIFFTFSFVCVLSVCASSGTLSAKVSIDAKAMFTALTLINVVLAVFFVPFSLLFFKPIFVEIEGSILWTRMTHAFIGAFVLTAVFLVIAVPLYFFGNAQGVNFVEMCVAALAFIGWWLLAVLVGVGLVSLPAELYKKFSCRPVPMMVEEYNEKRVALGNKAKAVREKAEKGRAQLASKSVFEKRKFRNNFTNTVAKIKDNYIHLQVAYHMKGGNPIVPYVCLVFSVLSAVFSLLWLLQIMISVILIDYIELDIFGTILTAVTVDGFYVVSVAFFLFFAFYLYTAAASGLLFVSYYLPFLLAGYKMESRNTYSDAFLVNSGLFLLMSLSAVHFLTRAMPKYVSGSYIDVYFDKIDRCALFKQFYATNLFFYLVLVFSVVALILCLVLPPKHLRKMQNALDQIDELTVSAD